MFTEPLPLLWAQVATAPLPRLHNCRHRVEQVEGEDKRLLLVPVLNAADPVQCGYLLGNAGAIVRFHGQQVAAMRVDCPALPRQGHGPWVRTLTTSLRGRVVPQAVSVAEQFSQIDAGRQGYSPMRAGMHVGQGRS